MKKIGLFSVLLLIIGCYVPNDPPSSEFAFGFKGRLEKLEDAFFNTKLNYKELKFRQHSQKTPEYYFTIKRKDTTIKYTITLQDCQSIYYLVKWNDDWKCDSSYVHILSFKHNLDTLSKSKAKKIFKEDIIQKIKPNFEKITNTYNWEINRFSEDSVIVDIINQNKKLRKRHFFSMDTVGNSIAEKKIVSFIGDSVIIYKNMARQQYMYIESKKTLHNNGYKK